MSGKVARGRGWDGQGLWEGGSAVRGGRVWVVVRRAEAERVWEDAVAVICGGMVVGSVKGVK